MRDDKLSYTVYDVYDLQTDTPWPHAQGNKYKFFECEPTAVIMF